MPFENNFDLHSRSIQFTTTHQPTNGFEIHYHPFYEIYYFITGNADYLVEGREYHLTPHSLLLLSPHIFHGVRVNNEDSYTRCAIHFSPDTLSTERRSFLLSSFPGTLKASPKEVFYEHTEDFDLYTYFKFLILSQNQPVPFCEEYFPVYLESLLAQISLMCHTLHPSAAGSNVPDTITELIHYLNENLTEPLTLDALSKRFFISKYYMNRAFKKATGTTVMNYLTYKRVTLAKYFIRNGATAANAALNCGFGDYSSFYRAYKKILGCTPGKDHS